MYIEKIINNLSGIGTFISSIIALYALKELIKQRRAMYRPRLFLSDFTLSVKGNPLVNPKNFYYFKLHNLYEPENKEDISKHSISSQVFLENIGFGIANKVKYEWSFDFKKAIKILCELDKELKHQIRKDDNSVIIERKGEYFNHYQFDDLNKEKNIDFIKPESLKTNNKPLSIPMIISSIHMDYVLLKNNMKTEICERFEYEEYVSFPIPKLKISYEDIAGKKYTSVYNFKLSCSNSFYQKDIFKIDTNNDYAFLTFKSI